MAGGVARGEKIASRRTSSMWGALAGSLLWVKIGIFFGGPVLVALVVVVLALTNTTNRTVLDVVAGILLAGWLVHVQVVLSRRRATRRQLAREREHG